MADKIDHHYCHQDACLKNSVHATKYPIKVFFSMRRSLDMMDFKRGYEFIHSFHAYIKVKPSLQKTRRLNIIQYSNTRSNMPNMAKYAKYPFFGAYLGASNMVKWSVPEKILRNAVQTHWSQVNRTLQAKVMTKSNFWPISPIPVVITMSNFKVVARTDLWVYKAENFCVSFLTKMHPFFTCEGGK